MNIKKVFFTIFLFAILILPSVAYGWDDIDWGIELGGDNWSFSIGSGSMNSYGLPDGSILGIIQNILGWMLTIISMVGIIGFIISGILYLTAAGDDGQIEKAKKAMTYSIIGVIVGISGFVVMQAAFYMLSAQTF